MEPHQGRILSRATEELTVLDIFRIDRSPGIGTASRITRRNNLLPRFPAAFAACVHSSRAGALKADHNQAFMGSVLNRRSPEGWRKTVKERQFRVRVDGLQCAGFLRKARSYCGFVRAQRCAENSRQGRRSGGSGTGIQHSPPGCPPALRYWNEFDGSESKHKRIFERQKS